MISTTVLVKEAQFENQEDLYWSQKNGDTWQIARPLLPPMNTGGNEGSQSFSSDGRYMFFVACDRKEGLGVVIFIMPFVVATVGACLSALVLL